MSHLEVGERGAVPQTAEGRIAVVDPYPVEAVRPTADRHAAQTITRLLIPTESRGRATPGPGDDSWRDGADGPRPGALASARVREVLPTGEARARLSQIATLFDHKGATAPPVVFGSHRRPQGVILAWELWQTTRTVSTLPPRAGARRRMGYDPGKRAYDHLGHRPWKRRVRPGSARSAPSWPRATEPTLAFRRAPERALNCISSVNSSAPHGLDRADGRAAGNG
jgi:hypothetical protein